MPRLHMTEGADLFRNIGKTDRNVMIVGRKLAYDLFEQHFIVGDQLALSAPLLRITEDIERGAAQGLEFRQDTKRRENPRSKRHLLRQAGDLILAGEQRRRQMELEREIIARDFVLDLRQERRLGV